MSTTGYMPVLLGVKPLNTKVTIDPEGILGVLNKN
jgi:hypothetical protein